MDPQHCSVHMLWLMLTLSALNWFYETSNSFAFPIISQYRDRTGTGRLRQDGSRFPDDTFERIFLNENVIILIKISLKFVPYGPINNIPALVQIMAWRWSGDKPLSEPMMGRLPTHICVTRPQWLQFFFVRNMDPFTLHNQYHGCWWPGNARSQGISSYGIDLDTLKVFYFQHQKG